MAETGGRVRGIFLYAQYHPSPTLHGIWVITGPPGIGKSTIVSKVVLRLKSAGVIVGGCTTAEVRAEGSRIGFEVRNLTSGTHAQFATTTGGLGPKVGKYRVNLASIASVGAAGLLEAVASSELIVMDEVGPMELVSPDFRRAARACVDSGKPILAVIHERLEDDLLSDLRSMARATIVVSQNNRDQIPERLASDLLLAVGGPKTS